MILNEEWYIIPRELEEEGMIYQNYIKQGSHLKGSPTLKEIKKFAYDWNNIEKDIRKFYFKYPICEIRNSKTKKKTYIKANRIGLSQAKIPSWYGIFGWLHFKWYKIFIYDGWSFHKVWMNNFNENKKAESILNAFKQWLTSYLKPKNLNTDNGGELKNKVIENYLKENNIDHIT